jgi:hypothetical protein
MYEVYAHTETARKEQPAIRLRHMGRGPNDCRRQPRPQFAVAEGKTKAETRQYKEDQFRALEDRCEASPTQISNLYRHNEYESRNPSAERRTHGRQHHAQAHATRWVDGFKLDFPEFPGVLQPSEFWYWTLAVEEFFKVNGVGDPQRVPLVALTFRGVVASWWRHLKQQRMRQGKRKIRSWVQLLKKLLDYFVPKFYTMDRHQRNWSQESTAVTKKIANSYKKEVSRKSRSDAKSPQQANWAPTDQPQILTPNPYFVEEENEYVDEELQESEIFGKEFEHECVEDVKPSQGDGQPIVAKQELTSKEGDINGVVPGSKLPTHPLHTKSLKKHEELEKEVEEVSLSESIALFHEEEPLEEVNLSDSLAILYGNPIHYVIDKTSEDKIHDFKVEIINYVDFLGIDNILLNVGFCAVGKIFVFTREKAREEYGKSEELPSGVLGFHNKHRSMLMMKSVALIVGYCLVLIVRNVEWNELTGHPKDRGKDRPNSRTNSLQQGENDVVGKHGEFSQTRAVTKARPDGPITVRTRSFSREGTKLSVRSPFGSRPNVMLFLYFIYVLLESRPNNQMSRPDA